MKRFAFKMYLKKGCEKEYAKPVGGINLAHT